MTVPGRPHLMVPYSLSTNDFQVRQRHLRDRRRLLHLLPGRLRLPVSRGRDPASDAVSRSAHADHRPPRPGRRSGAAPRPHEPLPGRLDHPPHRHRSPLGRHPSACVMADQPARPTHRCRRARRRSPPAALLGDPAIALGLTLAVLDGAIANVALPTIARDLDASPAASIWVVNAYQLAITISLLPLASLGDIYRLPARLSVRGWRCSRSRRWAARCRTRWSTLTIARIVQGFGAAGIMSVNGALVRFIYPRALARPWRRAQRDGRLDRVGGRADRRRRHPVGRAVAVAVRDQRADRRRRAARRPARAARRRRAPAPVRLRERAVSALVFGLLVSAVDGLGHGEGLAWSVAELCFALGVRLRAGDTPTVADVADAAGRSAAHSAVRAVGRHVDLRRSSRR